ncbi:hypothetical protein [Pseudaminobacter sp. NGMCC 1.201702]|uniref:hypothetical protein n=1 Tax=Pseudaminobacter sp. NGMCC 1.201702 TaxID=3391825 RepID=UPI0039F0AF00
MNIHATTGWQRASGWTAQQCLCAGHEKILLILYQALAEMSKLRLGQAKSSLESAERGF